MENPLLVAEAEHANSSQTRIIWVDLARAGAILSVITYHVGILPIGWVFSAFQLPLFAFLSGYTTRWEALTIPKMAQKWLRWGSVYAASGLFSLAIWYALIPLYTPLPTILQFSPQTQWNGFISGAGLPANGPLWFFLPFALATTLVAGILSLNNKKQAALLICILFFLTNVPTKIFVLFLLLGAIWKKWNVQPQLRLWQFLTTLTLFFVCASQNRATDLHYGHLGNPILFLVSSLTGTLLVLHIASWKKIPTLLSWIGKQSLPLFVLHWPAMFVVTFTLFKLSILPYFDAQPGLVGAIITKPTTITQGFSALLLWFLLLANTLALTLGMSEGFKKIYSVIMYRRESTH